MHQAIGVCSVALDHHSPWINVEGVSAAHIHRLYASEISEIVEVRALHSTSAANFSPSHSPPEGFLLDLIVRSED